MRHVASEVLANDYMPCWPVSSIKLLLDLCSDVLLDVVFFEGSGRDVDAFLLHLIAHINILDDGF